MKDIQGFEGLYAATSCGKIWSYKSKRFLKPKLRSNGYLEVTLCKDATKTSYLVHRLIAQTYIPNPDNLPQVSHLDESKDNNAVTNLCWVSAKTNCNMPLHIQRKSKSQLNNATSKQVVCIETGDIYPSMSEAARVIGCTPQNIYQACKFNYKTACGYHWRKLHE